jgi:tetratricopeptide (TPR) repeat protein
MSSSESSIKYLEEKLKDNPKSLVFTRVADFYRKSGRIQEAINICLEGINNHPEYITGRIILGRCYLEQEKLKEAFDEFVKAISLDRRNMVAIKMLGDIYARQGLKEKAGDLYSLVLGMDPDNINIAKLSSTYKGIGERDLKKIIGITEAIHQNQIPDTTQDFISDLDKTIQMDKTNIQEESIISNEIGENFVKTREFEQTEIPKANAEPVSAATDENIEINQAVADTITGSDVTARMEILFGEEEKTEEPKPEPEEIKQQSVEREETPDYIEKTSVFAQDASQEVVTGSDISSRIEMLFGEEEKATRETNIQTEITSPSKESEISAEETLLKEQEQESAPISQDELKLPQTAEIAGEDIASRLNEMFGEETVEPISLEKTETFLKEDGLDLQPATSFEKSKEIKTDATEEIKISDLGEGLPQEDFDDATISGDDVALRLETILEDKKEEVEAGTDVVPLSEIESKAEEEQPKSYIKEESNNEIFISEQEEYSKPLSETIVSNKKEEPKEVLVNENISKDEDQISIIDEAEAEESSPVMSGEDVVGRLNELFSDSLLPQSEQSPDMIPEEEEENVGKGFYTMSGEDITENKSSEEMLTLLDQESATEISEKEEYFDNKAIEREPQEKTVFLDEEGSDTISLDQKTSFSKIEDPFIDTKAETVSKPEESVAKAADEEETLDVLNEIPQPKLEKPDNEENLIEGQEDFDEAQTQVYSIPDHVLTPTLADIYYQQGQPKLALQMYRRLLAKDPDNEKISKRIQEIEEEISQQEADETISIENGEDKKEESSLNRQESLKKEKRISKIKSKSRIKEKPLAGVRISKKIKLAKKKKKDSR